MNATVRKPDVPVKIRIVYSLYYLSLYLMNIVSLCSCNVFMRHQVSDIIDKTEELTNMFMMEVDTNVAYRKMRSFVVFEVALLVFVNGVTTMIYVYVMYDASALSILVPVLESLGCMCNSLMITQFVSLVMLLRHICKCMNRDLRSCCDILEDSSRYSITRSHPGGVATFRPAASLRNQIHGLRIAYSRLCTVTRFVASYYGLPNLLGASWLFMSIVSILYTTLYLFTNGAHPKGTAERYSDISCSVSWCIYCGILITAMAMSCHLVGDETAKMMFHTQKLLLHTDLGKETGKELKKFCSQLKYLKLEFTAFGFFTLNLPFLNAFISTCFVYFVIMFQLK